LSRGKFRRKCDPQGQRSIFVGDQEDQRRAEEIIRDDEVGEVGKIRHRRQRQGNLQGRGRAAPAKSDHGRTEVEQAIGPTAQWHQIQLLACDCTASAASDGSEAFQEYSLA